MTLLFLFVFMIFSEVFHHTSVCVITNVSTYIFKKFPFLPELTFDTTLEEFSALLAFSLTQWYAILR